MRIDISLSTLFVVFIGLTALKITGVIAWSWWAVTLPILLPVYIAVAILLGVAAVWTLIIIGSTFVAICKTAVQYTKK